MRHATYRRAPDDADPPIFAGYEDDLSFPTTLDIKGRQFDVDLRLHVYGSHYGEEIVVSNAVTVIGANGGRRDICAPYGTGKTARDFGMTGFTAELSDAVAKWIDESYDEIEAMCRWRVA